MGKKSLETEIREALSVAVDRLCDIENVTGIIHTEKLLMDISLKTPASVQRQVELLQLAAQVISIDEKERNAFPTADFQRIQAIIETAEAA